MGFVIMLILDYNLPLLFIIYFFIFLKMSFDSLNFKEYKVIIFFKAQKKGLNEKGKKENINL